MTLTASHSRRTDEHEARKWAGFAAARLFKQIEFIRERLAKNEVFAKEERKLRAKGMKNLLATATRRFVIEEVERANSERFKVLLINACPKREQPTHWKVSNLDDRARIHLDIGDFCTATAPDWFTRIIWPRLEARKDDILADAEIRNSQVYKTAVKNKCRAYLSDFKTQFRQATMTLARRPAGLLRGVNRPT